jgi:hypothetical protein
MADLGTREQCGRTILSLYKQDGIQANEGEMWQYLHSRLVLALGSLRAADLETGLQWCVDMGYLEQEKNKRYILTEKGFDAM